MSHLTKNKLSHYRKEFVAAISVVATIALATVFLNADNIRSSVIGSIDTSTYQAIRLDTGETYFGKVMGTKDGSVTISDIFYFLDDTKKTLVKRGKRADSEGGLLTINHERILTTENLDENSAVLKAIKSYKNKK